MPKATIESIAAQNEQGVIASSMTTDGQPLLNLRLDQISLDPVTDVRVGPAAKDEEAKIDSLARAIYSGGQLQPVVVRPNGEGDHYLLVAGRRRYAAFKLIEQKTGEKVTIQAVLRTMNDQEAYSAAIQENLQRKQFSPIELAQNILEIRKRNGFDGEDWSKHVAEFLHVSRATVTQHAKLLDLPSKIREKVHSGTLSAQSAFELAKIEESQREVVLAKAEEEAEAEEKQAKATLKAKPSSNKKSLSKGDAVESEEKGKVQHKHIVKAAREVAESENYVKPRSRGEIVSFFAEIIESGAYPEPIVKFAETLVNKWATGQVGDRSLLNKLDAIAELCDDRKAGKKGAK